MNEATDKRVSTTALKRAQTKLENLTSKLDFPTDDCGYPWRTGVGIGRDRVYLYVREKTDAIVAAIPQTLEVEDMTIPVEIVQTGVIRPLIQPKKRSKE